jgi:hypothetical protein
VIRADIRIAQPGSFRAHMNRPRTCVDLHGRLRPSRNRYVPRGAEK